MSERALRRISFCGKIFRFKEEEEEIDRKTAIIKVSSRKFKRKKQHEGFRVEFTWFSTSLLCSPSVARCFFGLRGEFYIKNVQSGPFSVYSAGIEPYERPMPCGDMSIQQPFKENTVGLKVMHK